ncbi:TetR/AcrR family transcriptional regulator [Hydrogenoanaerobacterium sp.]|uniref:TetR/AcrR family transcriptional regulator n=1 Tax=Hydrogenoanaerobacterium sp. TaxID=2953763 RepID=UPI00289C0585|nr:TetR/AcrR family transcriptional regulator [Hydrogenoanaerobacterium sp.]
MNNVITSKEAILSAARQIAAEKGLPALNMRTVAAACGIAVGSVYNYFPSKTDLVIATIEDVWKSIFHKQAKGDTVRSFIDEVQWLSDRIRTGTEEYPSFFTVHAMGVAQADRKKGRIVMNEYFVHMKAGLLQSLQADSNVRSGVFTSDFTQEDFVSFVFSNLITSFATNAKSCSTLFQVVRRILYS